MKCVVLKLFLTVRREGLRVYKLGSENQTEIEERIKILASASYDYMKLIILELQQKLTEINKSE